MNNFSGKPTAKQLREYKKKSPAYFNELVEKYKNENPEYYEKVVKFVEGGIPGNQSSVRALLIIVALAVMGISFAVFFLMASR